MSAQPHNILFAFIPPGVSVGEFRCAVGSRAELEAIQHANEPRLGCVTGAIRDVECGGLPIHELRLSQPNGLEVVFWTAR